MLKKTITYTNPFTDQEVTEEHYFHISKADLVEMEMEEHANTYQKDGRTLTGMEAKLQRIVDSQDGKAIISELKDLIRRAYGRKEGDRFLKSPAIWEEFSSTEAFSQLLWELCTNAEAASEFMNGIVPQNLDRIADDIREQALQQAKEAPSPSKVEEDPTGLTNKTIPRVLTQTEITEMNSDELKSGLAAGRYKLS